MADETPGMSHEMQERNKRRCSMKTIVPASRSIELFRQEYRNNNRFRGHTVML